MSSIQPRKGEKLVLQEDCYEDNLKNGLLTLTNQRLLFEKTEGTLATLSKRTEELLLDIPLVDIKASKAEGFLLKKVVVITLQNNIRFTKYISSTGWCRYTS